jgi:phosphoenolpyruvate phosphomutase
MKETAPSLPARLRQLITSPQTEFLMEAHSGISARIVAEAGFKGIWASGLAISAQAGVRDSNELSWTQVLDCVELMADASGLPILLDGDTGYGDFNSMRRLVRKLEQAGGAGVCIEDKLFPKTNSFLAGEAQPLADIDEFCGKLQAGRDSRLSEDFVIVARVEALIAGWGLEEALERAEAYRRAGADAILVHSKKGNADEVLAFARQWGHRCPLVVVPTKYYSTPTEVFRKDGIDLVIWANHMLRASVSAMQRVAGTVFETESLVDVEDKIAPVNEIFRLQDAEELLAAERTYAPSAKARGRAIILGASRGEELDQLTADRPKVMVPVNGEPLLRRVADRLKRRGIGEIHLVTGYKADSIDVQGIRLIHNPEYASGGELGSLACAADALDDEAVLLYGDLLFRSYMLEDLLEAEGELVTVVDSGTLGDRDLAYCSAADDRGYYRQPVRLEHISDATGWQGRTPQGRWIGMLRCRRQGARWIREALDTLALRPDFFRLGVPDLLNHLIAEGWPIRVVYVSGRWLDVNNLEDLQKANTFASGE